MKHYVVADGRSIAYSAQLSPETPFGFGTVTEGAVIQDDDPRWSKEDIEKFVKNGSLIEISNPADMAEALQTRGKAGGGQEESEGTVTQSAFNLDPDGIRGMKLDQLNVMLAERGAEPAKSAKEAIATLTADYEAPKA